MQRNSQASGFLFSFSATEKTDKRGPDHDNEDIEKNLCQCQILRDEDMRKECHENPAHKSSQYCGPDIFKQRNPPYQSILC